MQNFANTLSYDKVIIQHQHHQHYVTLYVNNWWNTDNMFWETKQAG